MTEGTTPKTPLPSATVMLLRDGIHPSNNLEVFMVVRHHQIDFMSGALVFPGGKTATGDSDPSLRRFCDGVEGVDDQTLSIRAAAIREAFEECGVFLARHENSKELISAEKLAELDPYRPALDKGELGIAELLKEHELRLACDLLVPFAHWITPEFMPKRFDTHFYLAHAPEDHLAVHDGSEAVDSVWINPDRCLQEADDGKWSVIFPTRMNVEKLGRSASVSEALTSAKADSIVTVMPAVEQRGEESFMVIPEEAGYSLSEIPMDKFAAGMSKR